MMKEIKSGFYKKNGTDIEFNFSTNLSAYEKLNFVASVTDNIVGQNYNSLIRDLMFDFNIICFFSDIDMFEIKNSANAINEIEEFLDATTAVDIIKANMCEGLLVELSNAVDDNIEYRTGIHRNKLQDSIASFVKVLEEKFSHIDADDMMALASKLGNATEELTAERITDAYQKSDAYKRVLREADAEKQRREELYKNVAKAATGKN